MQTEDMCAPRRFVQAIHILGDDGQIIENPFHPGDGRMTGIRFRLSDKFTTVFVELPHPARVCLECLRRGEFFWAEVFPDPVQRVPESWDP